MPLENTLIAAYQNCFQLKALFSPCTLFCLIHYDLNTLEQQLAEKIALNPSFFQNSPVVIDLEKVTTIALNFARLKDLLLRYQLIPIGIRNASETQKQAAALVGLPLLNMGKSATNHATTSITHHTKNNEVPIVNESKFISQPVRSGMQVYAKHTDLIVTSSVSPGAEIIADGNIHVYGHLRGRALAGMQGNKQARIFCRYFDAELVAIAGYYLTKEERPALPAQSGMLHIYLDNEKIKIEEI